MAIEGQPAVSNRQTMKVSSLSLDKEELLKFCKLLQERAYGAADIEVSKYKQGDITDEQFELNKKTLQDCFKLKITIRGATGEELFGTIDEVFNSVNFPEEVQSFYVDSESTLKFVHNYYPRNGFSVFLDFSKPKVLDFSFLPSQETPNASRIEVKGYDATWVNGVFSEVKSFIVNKKSTLSTVHHHSVYDVLLWFLGFPLGFWICNKLADKIDALFVSTFATSAVYVYVFIATLFIFRILFHYLRWVLPLVEYRSKGNKILIHRAVITVIFLGLVTAFVYDILKWATGIAE